jgi:Ca2+-binding RTX toxin-like protein
MAREKGRSRGALAVALAAVASALAFVPGAGAELRAGDLLVTDYEGRVLQVKARSGNVSTFANDPRFTNPSELSFTPNRRVIVTDEGNGSVFTVTPGGDVRRFVSGLITPYGTAFSPVHGLLVADYEQVALLRVRGRNDTATLADAGMFSDPIGVAVAPNGTPFVIEQDFFAGPCGIDCGGVIEIAPNGSQTETSSGGGFADPTDGIVGPDRTIYVSDQDSGALSVNPGSGAQTLLSPDGSIVGNGIALDFAGRPLVTTNTGVARIRPDQSLDEIAPLSGDSNDVAVVPPSCAGKWATFFGTEGPDTIKASPGPDVIAALGGNDIVKTRGGRDVICGGGGRDTLNGGPGRDRAVGGAAEDACRAETRRSC